VQAQSKSKAHQVTPNPGGWYDVTPGILGGATCTCDWFCRNPRATKACSRVEAVLAFARTVRPASAPVFLTPEEAADLQAATAHVFDRIQRGDLLPWPARTSAVPAAVEPTTTPGPARTEAPRSVRPGPGAPHVHQSRPDQDCYCAFGVEAR